MGGEILSTVKLLEDFGVGAMDGDDCYSPDLGRSAES